MKLSVLNKLAFIFLLHHVECYKFLLYMPKVAHSHVNFMGKIADLLVEAGHEAVLFMPLADPDCATNGSKNAEIITLDLNLDQNLFKNFSALTDPFHEDINIFDDTTLKLFRTILMDVCQGLVTHKDRLIKELKGRDFDVAFIEIIDHCGFGLFELLEIPATILVSAAALPSHVAEIFGLPVPSSYVPDVTTPFSDQMSILERAMNIVAPSVWVMFLNGLTASQNELYRQNVDPKFPSLETLSKKASLAFINGVEFLEFPRPISHQIFYVGGMAVPKVNALDQKFAKILENSKHGTILVSFGSLANSTRMPMKVKKAIIECFSHFSNYNFIWKYEDPGKDRQLFEGVANIFTFEWLPQVDLLNIRILDHPNVKIFITHGGMNSITESVYSGTPMIVIPLFADQEHNAAAVVARNIGINVKKTTLHDPTALRKAISDILTDQKFERNAKRLKKMLEKKPVQSRELVLKWTEFVAEFKDLSNLNLAGRDLSFVKYFNLDIFGMLLIVAILIAFLFYRLLRYLLGKFAWISRKTKRD